MYKLIVIGGGAVIVLGWIAYGIYTYLENKKEKNMPKRRSQHFNKVKNSFDDYAKKMAEFEKKKYNKNQ